MYLYVCSQPGLEEYIALRDPLAVHLDLYVSRGGFLVFFCLFSVVYTRGLLLCARVIVVVKRVRERLCGHVPPKKTTLSLSLSLSLSRVSLSSTAEVCSFCCSDFFVIAFL